MNKMIITGLKYKDNSGYHVYYVPAETNEVLGIVIYVNKEYQMTDILYNDIDFLRRLWKEDIQDEDMETLDVVHHNTTLKFEKICENFEKAQRIEDTIGIRGILTRLGHVC